ncbi:unnamed protein product, partial [Pleuronectes platessa]
MGNLRGGGERGIRRSKVKKTGNSSSAVEPELNARVNSRQPRQPEELTAQRRNSSQCGLSVRRHRQSQKQDEGLLLCHCRWGCQSVCQWQMVEGVKGKWKPRSRLAVQTGQTGPAFLRAGQTAPFQGHAAALTSLPLPFPALCSNPAGFTQTQ